MHSSMRVASYLAIGLAVTLGGGRSSVLADCPGATNDGIEFLLTYPDSLVPPGAILAIMTDDPVAHDVTVTAPRCTNSPWTVAPSASAPATVLPCDDTMVPDRGVQQDFAITISRDAPYDTPLQVVFKAGEDSDGSNDAFLVLPKDRLGTSYWPMGYRQSGTNACGPSRWVAVATGGTTLSYTNCSGSPDTASMSSLDVFQDRCADADMNDEATGFEVEGSTESPFALISGSVHAFIPAGAAASDALLEMMPPASWAGTQYLVTEFNKPGSPGNAGDLVRVLATADDTHVIVTPADGGSATINSMGDAHPCPDDDDFYLDEGEFCDLHIAGGALVAASDPIFVGHFMKGWTETGVGDSSFTLVTPIAHLRCDHKFFSFGGFPYDSGSTGGSYVNIVARGNDIDNLLLDGEPLYTEVTCLEYARFDYDSSDWAWARCLLADPPSGGEQHVLSQPGSPAPDDERFAAYAYGQSDTYYQTAYAYPTGFGF